MLFTEIKYLNLLSTRLLKFKKKKDFLWNFRCPICGDSQNNKNKARGFVFQVKGDLVYKCHNCNVGLGFGKFLEIIDPILHKEYKMEKFQDSTKKRKLSPDMRKVKRIVSGTPQFKKSILSGLDKIDSLNKEHPAREYLDNRNLPTESLYYTEKFKEWTNSVKPNSFEDTTRDEPRIIIPFIDKDGECFGYQGRSLESTGLRYITILLEERTKIFGLNTIDPTKTVYVTEGPLDSLLLDNAIAMAGADVHESSELRGLDLVYVYDNEPRNKQITDRIAKHIKAGHKVVIWSGDIKEKDINDMVLAGRPVNDIVQKRTFKGLASTLKLNEWRK